MYATNYLEKGFLNTMKGITLTAPTNIYIALFLSSPTETGVAGVEVNYAGYERQVITFTTPTHYSGGIGIKNDTQIEFAKSDRDAGTITHIGITDSKIGGNMLAYGEPTEVLSVAIGEAPVFLQEEVIYYLTGDLSEVYKKKLLNIFRKQNIEGFIPQLALFNGDPETAGGEITGENYERVALEFTAPVESSNGNMVTETNEDANFNRPSTDWGTWRNTAIMDSVTSGNPVWKQALSIERQIRKGYMPMVGKGDLKVAIN